MRGQGHPKGPTEKEWGEGSDCRGHRHREPIHRAPPALVDRVVGEDGLNHKCNASADPGHRDDCDERPVCHSRLATVAQRGGGSRDKWKEYVAPCRQQCGPLEELHHSEPPFKHLEDRGDQHSLHNSIDHQGRADVVGTEAHPAGLTGHCEPHVVHLIKADGLHTHDGVEQHNGEAVGVAEQPGKPRLPPRTVARRSRARLGLLLFALAAAELRAVECLCQEEPSENGGHGADHGHHHHWQGVRVCPDHGNVKRAVLGGGV
mmetsp:Transcript_14742/g.43611  ORF Transcript_14742/g.43611 Transcript_14742/m.43611 type:complete len:261 (+) Transcript_14742:1352-2134(+)